jgi:hypothetical protein
MPELDLETVTARKFKEIVEKYESILINKDKCEGSIDLNLLEKRISGIKTESNKELIDRLKEEGNDDYLILEIFLNIREKFLNYRENNYYKSINLMSRPQFIDEWRDDDDETISLSTFERDLKYAKEELLKLNSDEDELIVRLTRDEVSLETTYKETDQIIFSEIILSKVLSEMGCFPYKKKFTFEFYKSLEERFGHL